MLVCRCCAGAFDFSVEVDTRLEFIEHVVVVAVVVVVLDVEFTSDAKSWRSCSCC